MRSPKKEEKYFRRQIKGLAGKMTCAWLRRGNLKTRKYITFNDNPKHYQKNQIYKNSD